MFIIFMGILAYFVSHNIFQHLSHRQKVMVFTNVFGLTQPIIDLYCLKYKANSNAAKQKIESRLKLYAICYAIGFALSPSVF